MRQAAAPGEVIAAIDLGSSAVRLSLARVDAQGEVRPFLQHRVPVRLGADVFAGGGGGALGEAVQRELVGALQLLQDFCTRHHATRVRAVATAAMREAKNAAAVCRRVQAEVGLVLEVLDGAQEGQLARQALSAALARQNCQVPQAGRLYVDLGGGSLELEGGDGAPRTSLPLGTVRLLAQLPQLAQPLAVGRPSNTACPAASADSAPFAAAAAAVTDLLQQALAPYAAELARPDGWTLIGSGGNLEAMANLLPAADHDKGRRVELAGLLPLARRVAPLSLAQRSERFGVRPDRADLLLPALLVVDALARLTRARALWVPGSGLRDGLLAALARPAAAVASRA